MTKSTAHLETLVALADREFDADSHAWSNASQTRYAYVN
jgi:hypothetical protein